VNPKQRWNAFHLEVGEELRQELFEKLLEYEDVFVKHREVLAVKVFKSIHDRYS